MFSKQSHFVDTIAESSFSGIIIKEKASTLLKLLGKPTEIGSPDNKTQLEWAFIDSENTCRVITIYDYKANCPIHKIEEWHIGAKGLLKKEIIDFLDGQGITKIETEK